MVVEARQEEVITVLEVRVEVATVQLKRVQMVLTPLGAEVVVEQIREVEMVVMAL